jgi:hypothetical protein
MIVKTRADLQNEVEELIYLGIEAGQTMPADWIIDEVVRRHPKIAGEDSDFYILCAFDAVREAVRKCLRAHKTESGAKTPEQLRFPGYDCLHKAYLIEHEDKQVIVPLSECTLDELQMKSKELRRMADGCVKHANEIDRYCDERFGIQGY